MTAILLSGVVVMAVYKVAKRADIHGARDKRVGAVAVIVAAVIVLAVPLSITSRTVAVQSLQSNTINDVASAWVGGSGWRVADVAPTADGYRVLVAGTEPDPDTARLRAALNDAGLANVSVTVELVPERVVALPPDG